MVPGIPEPPMRRTSVEQADSLTHGHVALHVLAALGTLVQLLPAAFRGFVVAHSQVSFKTADQAPDTPWGSVVFHRPSVATAAISEPASTGFVR